MPLITSYSTQNWHNVGAFASAKESYSAGQVAVQKSKVGASGGTTDGWWGDISGYWYKNGYPEGKAQFGGDNGKEHWAIFSFGGSPCRYLQEQVTAMKFYQRNDSTAGHGMYVNRFGLELIADGGATEVWDLSGEMGRPSSYGKWHEKSFNSALMADLRYWKINKIWIQISTHGGKGNRATNTTVEQLQFKTAGNSGWKIILPMVRDSNKRQHGNMIG